MIDRNADNQGKMKALELAVTQIEKQFGKGSIMKLGSGDVSDDVQVVSTGSLSLDLALGVGGLPRGRVVEIFGPESSGKTTLCLHVIAETQKIGGYAAFIDAEHALDVSYAKKLGVRSDDLLVAQPDTGEQALEITETLVRSGAIDLVVVDSVAALVPRAEIEGEMGDSHMGLQGAPDVPGPPQIDGGHFQIHDHGDLHQPDPDEDRGDVRQSRNHDRRERLEVLFFGAAGHSANRVHQGGAGGDGEPGPRQSGEEQDGASF